jgi:hypothetical protein
MFSASNTAFIACPGAESVALELDIIRSVLEHRTLEPYIAIENYDPAKDVFCEKICTKIIESKLCVVLLTDPLMPEGYTSPNPNVYYEYGLMTAFGKRIIPLQRKDHVLAFNVRSLDTIKYNNFDLRRVFEKVLTDILEEVHNDENKSLLTGEPIRALNLYMELQGYGKTNTHIVHGTPFRHFGKPDESGNKYSNKYGLVIRNEGDFPNLRSSLTLVASRLQNLLNNKKKTLENLLAQKVNTSPTHSIEVDRAINKVQGLINTIEDNTEFVIVCANDVEMQHKIEQEARKIAELMNLKISIYNLDELIEQNELLGG